MKTIFNQSEDNQTHNSSVIATATSHKSHWNEKHYHKNTGEQREEL